MIDVSGAGILASSRHRPEAQRFLAFLVSRAGQEILAHSESYEYPLGSGVVTAKPLVPFSALRPDPITVRQLGNGSARDQAAARGEPAVGVGRRPDREMTTHPDLALSAPERRDARVRRRRRPARSGRPGRRRRCLPLVFLARGGAGGLVRRCRRCSFAADADAPLEHGQADGRGHRSCAPCSASRSPGASSGPTFPCAASSRSCSSCRSPMPDFVLGYSWISVDPGSSGYWGAVLVMSLGSYPLVYLPVAAALRTADPALEDVARGLGLGRWRTFFRVTFHQIRPALLGGSLLVALILLAEFGTFEILGFQTFTTEIYTENQTRLLGHDRPARSRSSSSLLGPGRARRRGSAGAGAAGRPGAGSSCGRLAGSGSAGCPCRSRSAWRRCSGPRSGYPVRALPTGSSRGPRRPFRRSRSPTRRSIPSATAGSPPRSPRSPRSRSRSSSSATGAGRTVLMERSTYLVQALPGLVVALSLVYFTSRYLCQLYHSSFELVFAYAIMFFPLALVAVRAGVAQAPLGPRGGRALARPQPPLGPAAGHAADPGARPGRRLRPRLPQRLDRADGDAHPPPDRRRTRSRPASGASRTTSPTAPRPPMRSRCSSSRMIPGSLLGRWFERIAGEAPT